MGRRSVFVTCRDENIFNRTSIESEFLLNIDTPKQTCFWWLSSPTATPNCKHSFRTWCLLVDVKTLLQKLQIIFSTYWNIRHFPLQISSTCERLHSRRGSSAWAQFICLTVSLGFSLTPFSLWVGTFHIHLPTAHPLTRPARSFHCV